VSNGDAPGYLGAMYNHLERRSNIWGLGYDQRQKFVQSAGLEIFDPARHDVLVWLGCAGAFEADFQKSLRSLFDILRAGAVTFGVLASERCTGDPAKRTGNEYMFQELANANIEDLRAAAPKRILTSCPHCLKTIGSDYRKFGFEVEVVHSSVFVEELTRGRYGRHLDEVGKAHNGRKTDKAGRADEVAGDGEPDRKVTFHDPCYLARYGGHVDEPRALLTRFGAHVEEPVRNRDNPFCCGAGGGLLFADKEEEPGSRISDVRFQQLSATGAGTVVTACPFCSIMLKGAQVTARTETRLVDLMTFVKERM
jgi:Fe-S oxidoreductase